MLPSSKEKERGESKGGRKKRKEGRRGKRKTEGKRQEKRKKKNSTFDVTEYTALPVQENVGPTVRIGVKGRLGHAFTPRGPEVEESCGFKY